MKIARIEKGDPLTAQYFNRVATAVNTLQQELAASPNGGETVIATPTGGTNATVNNITIIQQSNTTVAGIEPIQQTATTTQAARSTVYGEVARGTSTVRVEDPNDEAIYVDVDRIDSIILRGDQGDYLAFAFDNN